MQLRRDVGSVSQQRGRAAFTGDVVSMRGGSLAAVHAEEKLALIFPEIISHPMGGGRMRMFQLQTLLARLFDDRVVGWDLRLGCAVDPSQADEPWDDGSEAERVGTTESPRRAGLRRVCSDLIALSLFAWPRFVIQRTDPALRRHILSWIDDERPTHAIFVHPFAVDLVPDLHQRGIRVIIDCQNVESDLYKQVSAVNRNKGRRLDEMLVQRTIARWEKLYFPLAEQVWLPSLVDIARQQKVSPDDTRLVCVPNALDLAQYPLDDQATDASNSHDIVLPGSFDYTPNAVAARMLRDHVFPSVKRTIPDARILLVGRDTRGWAGELTNGVDVLATGLVPDTQPYFRAADVVVVPILQGSGTRFKILEALALGRPVVTTPLGTEGLAVRDGEHLLIRELNDFPEAIISLLSEPSRGRELGRAGRQLVEMEYSWCAVERILHEQIELIGRT